jgi:hypothetical protein
VAALAVAAAACSGSPGRHRAASPTTTTLLDGPTSTSPPTSSVPPPQPTTTSPPGAPAIAAPAGPASAAALFASLLPVERAIEATAPTAALVAGGAAQQRDLGLLTSHPDWLSSMPASTSPEVRAAIVAGVTAESELEKIGGPGPAPATLPPWQILPPQPAAELLADYQAAAASSGVPWPVFAAIHLIESRMGRIQGPSSAGAQGPMQFLPTTWAEYGAGGDIWSDRDAILAAGRFLHAHGAPADVAAAVLAYNPSAHYVNAVMAYASVMMANPRSFYSYYGWQVYVATSAGEFLLPIGFRGPGS